MQTRQYRKLPDTAIRKSVSLPETLVERVDQEAQQDGHHNFSRVVVVALEEHFERRDEESTEAVAS